MENFENKTSAGGSRSTVNEGEKFGKRVAEKVGVAAEVAGQKLDKAVDYVDSTTQNVRESLNKIRDEGWQGMCARTLEYTRKEPFAALMMAVGAGLFLGWITKRGR